MVRYGNVMGSRGSVILFFLKQRHEGILPITDPEMTVQYLPGGRGEHGALGD